MGLTSLSAAARVLAAAMFFLGSTTAVVTPILDSNFTMPSISTQAPLATTLPTDEAGLLALASRTFPPAFNTAYDRCPAICSKAGLNSANWTHYHSVKRLALCNQTMLLDFIIHNPLGDPSTRVSIAACTTDTNFSSSQNSSGSKRDIPNSCSPVPNNKEIQVSLQESSLGSSSQDATEVVAAAQQMQHYLNQKNFSCDTPAISFSRSGKATLGFFAGSQLKGQSLFTVTLQQFIDQVQTKGISGNYLIQLCGVDDLGADFALGIAASHDDTPDFVQESVATWSLGKCMTSYGTQPMDFSSWNTTTLSVPMPTTNSSSQYTNNSSPVSSLSERAIEGRTTSTAPVNNPDGTCYTHLTVTNDNCYDLATKYSLTVPLIESYNLHTWAWSGCADLGLSQNICLSNGTVPMPAPLANAVCGPQVNGTVRPSNMSTLATLNPCPLNACCDDWGQCGTTDEFCTVSTTTNLGTAPSGQNGCISNCGTGIVIGSMPAEFRKVGYFEGFNGNRKCLHMNVTHINLNSYTHIHMAFATITSDFNVNTSSIQTEFDHFVKMTGVKKILSFGGWSFSTDADTYPIFRSGVTVENRALFIANIVQFVQTYNLDGVDFDWEYPGATDIPGVPPGSPEDGTNYFSFLYALKGALPADITVSIAAPASFWYLKNFPIDAIGVIVDYIVFMTYDLHGQWDYGNKNSDPGCPLGNCLRSHVNLTETINALSMITKALVPSNKVVSGVASYGRSFQMTQAGCTGEACFYTGPASGATPGICTETAGYISEAEIDNIIATSNTTTWVDESFSNIMVYNNTQWVAYSNPANKATRINLFNAYALGGSTEWAIDLAANIDGDSTSNFADPNGNSSAPCDFSLTFASLEALEAVANNYPVYCAEFYALQAIQADLSTAYANYTDENNGYNDLFGYYVEYIKDIVPDTLDAFMKANCTKYFTCSETENGPLIPCSTDDTYNKVYWTLTNSTGFYADLLNIGVDPEWVELTTYDPNTCTTVYGGNTVCTTFGKFYNYPQRNDSMVVPNPKDIITAAGPNMTTVMLQIDVMFAMTAFGQYNGSTLDAVEVLALPVALVQQAVAGMAMVRSIGETQKKEDRIALIMNVLGVIFAVVPFLGEASATFVGLATLARVIALIGEVGNAALGIAAIVEDPSSAPMAVFGMLLGGFMLARDPENMSMLANLMKHMDTSMVTKMGSMFIDQRALIAKVARVCTA